jgi:hypothetical protein
MSSVVARLATVAVLCGCADQAEPLLAPSVDRPPVRGVLRPGAIIIVCKAGDVTCVPTYAVACDSKWAGDSIPAGAPAIPALSPEEQAWCVARTPADPSAP